MLPDASVSMNMHSSISSHGFAPLRSKPSYFISNIRFEKLHGIMRLLHTLKPAYAMAQIRSSSIYAFFCLIVTWIINRTFIYVSASNNRITFVSKWTITLVTTRAITAIRTDSRTFSLFTLVDIRTFYLGIT